MRILAVNWQDPKNPFAGGAEVHLWENLKRFASGGHSVTLVCCRIENAPAEEVYDGIRVVRKGRRALFNYFAPCAIRRELRRQRYDVLLEDINKIPFYTQLYTSIPKLLIVPHLFATTVFQEINFVMGMYIYLWEQPLSLLLRNNRYCVISESTKADLVKRGIPADNIEVIECGIDHGLYNPGDRIKYDTPTALYLGRVKKYKGVQQIIRAWPRVLAKVPNARLQVVGDGDYLEQLKQVASSMNLGSRIEFPGFVPAIEKVDRMRKAHCMIYPSLKEGWGLTNIEANACGTPAIAADSPGLRDSVRDGVSGMLFQYGNEEALAEKVVEIFTNSERRRSLEEGALKWASEFNWDTSADRLLSLMQSVVDDAKVTSRGVGD